MVDRRGRTDDGAHKSRRSPMGWLLGGALLILLAFLAIRGMSAGLDRDGSANADGPGANAEAH